MKNVQLYTKRTTIHESVQLYIAYTTCYILSLIKYIVYTAINCGVTFPFFLLRITGFRVSSPLPGCLLPVRGLPQTPGGFFQNAQGGFVVASAPARTGGGSPMPSLHRALKAAAAMMLGGLQNIEQ
jgi:hypothetical protein